MSYKDWMLKRRQLADEERDERRGEIDAARTQLQVAVTERAIRELYARIEQLEAKVKGK
jgi:hypothetical protein